MLRDLHRFSHFVANLWMNIYSEIYAKLERIELKLDALIDAVSRETDEEQTDLDGNIIPIVEIEHDSL